MNDIPWKTFTTEKDGVKLEVNWWDHDFNAVYKTGDVCLKYGRHIMGMCPLKYTEKWLREDFEKEGLYISFKEAGDIITSQTVFIESVKAQFWDKQKELKTKIDIYNEQLHELKQKYKAGSLTQTEYQNLRKPIQKQKTFLEYEYSNKCMEIAESISCINNGTKYIIRDYLKELWSQTKTQA